MDRGAWEGTVNGVAKSQAQLSNLAQHTSKNLFAAAFQIFWGIRVLSTKLSIIKSYGK